MTQPTHQVRPLGILLYTRTDVPHHPSIVPGIRALHDLAEANGFHLTHTEDPTVVVDARGSRPDVFVFLNTACDELPEDRREGLVRSIRGGSGFVGIHSASYFETEWPWYEALVGARFSGHPEPQNGRIDVIDRGHPATRDLPAQWYRYDEWYNFRTLPAGVRVLATLDETTYAGGAHGAYHPAIWCHAYEGARSFYTALGHTDECFSDEPYLRHILGALRWAGRLED
jgi:type 1 glutamine amidotransferase